MFQFMCCQLRHVTRKWSEIDEDGGKKKWRRRICICSQPHAVTTEPSGFISLFLTFLKETVHPKWMKQLATAKIWTGWTAEAPEPLTDTTQAVCGFCLRFFFENFISPLVGTLTRSGELQRHLAQGKTTPSITLSLDVAITDKICN